MLGLTTPTKLIFPLETAIPASYLRGNWTSLAVVLGPFLGVQHSYLWGEYLSWLCAAAVSWSSLK